jgi:hypothetical protein
MEFSSISRDSSHRYQIADPRGRSFATGLTKDGKQALIGILFPELVCILFNQEGELIQVQRRPFWDTQLASVPPQGIDKAELRKWQEELGFRPGQIHVTKFAIPELEVGIEDIPEHYLDAFRFPADFETDEAAALQKETEDWVQEGRFVLHWGTDYWLDGSGTVIAS